jgi:hypothetical protein
MKQKKKEKRKKKNILQDNHYLQGAYEPSFINGLWNSTAMKVTCDNYNWSTFTAAYTIAATTAITAATYVNVY